MVRRTLGMGMLLFVAACAGENDNPASTGSELSAAKQYIVVLKDTPQAGPAMASAVAQAQGITPVRVYQVALPGFVATLDAVKLQALRNDPRVSYIEEDRPVTISTTQTPTANWGLDRIDQVNLPLNNSYTYTQTGAGVHFYGIDTGILPTHVDVAGRMGNGFTSINDGNGTVDCNGHGTHTATTAGGTTYGVAKGMTIHPVRVLDCGGSGFTSGVIAGIDWVTANRILPAVANMSLGGGVSAAENQAVANSIAAGVVYAVSAGNSNVSACTQSPASEPLALTVAATNKQDKRANFSNFGTCVDLFAPGVNITAGWIGSNTATAAVSGTSMSSPHVAGVAGLYLEANPTHTPAQVSAAIVNNATPNKVTSPGTGSPNKLLYMGFLNTSPGNQAPVANFTYTCVAATHTCTLDSSTSTDDVGIASRQWKRPNGQVIGTGVTLTQAFPAAGTFNITLTVTDGGAPPLSNSKTIGVVVP